MTNKKPATREIASARQPTKLDAAMLRNLALQPESPGVEPDDDALQPTVELLTKLSSSNVDLVTNIIRCILVEQENKTP